VLPQAPYNVQFSRLASAQSNKKLMASAWSSTYTLGIHVKPYLTQIISTVLWRWLNNKSANAWQQAADLMTRLVVVIKQCGEDQLQVLSKLGLVLFEQLGEEYPDTLGSSTTAAAGAIAIVVGMTQMNPPVKDLCELVLIIPQCSLLMLVNYSAPNDACPP